MGRHQAEKPFIHPDFLLETETAKLYITIMPKHYPLLITTVICHQKTFLKIGCLIRSQNSGWMETIINGEH